MRVYIVKFGFALSKRQKIFKKTYTLTNFARVKPRVKMRDEVAAIGALHLVRSIAHWALEFRG